MSNPTTPPAPSVATALTSAGWAHLLQLGVAAVLFVGGAIHPGFSVPAWVTPAAAVGAPVMAIASTVLNGLHHHAAIKAAGILDGLPAPIAGPAQRLVAALNDLATTSNPSSTPPTPQSPTQPPHQVA